MEKQKIYVVFFAQTIQKFPPAGAGECAAPKLLQYAYKHQLKPIAMAEFWWGDSPKAEIRHHGYYYPACKGKCGPILGHMLQGLEVEENPLLKKHYHEMPLEIVYEDNYLVVINKPAGMLSVPGKGEIDSVYQHIKNTLSRCHRSSDSPPIGYGYFRCVINSQKTKKYISTCKHNSRIE